MLALIAAIARNGVIGRDGDLPWRLPRDARHFKRTTLGHCVVMGRRTFESLGSRPLPDRVNLIVSRSPELGVSGVKICGSLDAALAAAPHDRDVFVAGGAALYSEALPRADRLYLTWVHAAPTGDVFFPAFDPAEWVETACERFEPDARHAHAFRIVTLERRNGRILGA